MTDNGEVTPLGAFHVNHTALFRHYGLRALYYLRDQPGRATSETGFGGQL